MREGKAKAAKTTKPKRSEATPAAKSDATATQREPGPLWSMLARLVGPAASEDAASEDAEAEAEAGERDRYFRRPPPLQPPSELPSAVRDVLSSGDGHHLDATTRADLEPRFDHDFERVRIHTGDSATASARAVGADAYTVGNQIVIAGAFAPSSSAGRRLLMHELTHVVQQSRMSGPPPPGQVISHPDDMSEREAESASAGRSSPIRAAPTALLHRHSAADARLPATLAEALADAVASKAEIDAANARLATSPDRRRRNVPALIAQEGLTLQALTPRHDSTPLSPTINFFPGQLNYIGSVMLPDTVEYHIGGPGRTSVRIRARDESDVDVMHSGGEIENRLVNAVTEVAHTRASGPGAPSQFEIYRGRFNALWDTLPFSVDPTDFDPTLDSHGPRATRPRNIFNQIYADDPTFKAAYDANTGHIKERVDSYLGPDSFNPIDSPRLQRLRAAFFPYPTPITALATYTSFKADVTAACTPPLDAPDRQAVEASNDWQRLIDAHVITVDRRREIRAIIATVPPAAPVVAPPVVAAPPVVGGGLTPQQFVDRVTLDGPAAPVVGDHRDEPVTLTPRSADPNPSAVIDTRITVTPPNAVNGPNVSPDSPWPNGALSGVPFVPRIFSTAGSATAQLDLVHGAGGLTRGPPPPQRLITITDHRQTNLLASWQERITFNDGNRADAVFSVGDTVRYQLGSQTFGIGASLPAPLTNPGLSLFVKARILRGGVALFTSAVVPFPADQDRSSPITTALPEPGVLPDPLVFEVQIIASDGVTVLDTKIQAISVLASATYTQLDAEDAADDDNDFFHDPAPGGLLALMTAAGGPAAGLSASISAGTITILPLTIRHDSAAFVTAVLGGPHPERVGYFVGTTYGPPPDTAHSFAGVPGAAAFSRLGAPFSPHLVVTNRTRDVSTLNRRDPADVITLTVHEAIHALDVLPTPATALDSYKTEFRAYWMDGRYGPPDSATCPMGASNCFEARFDPTLPPPGPKSPRARAIFERELYGSATYPFVQPNYDNNPAFRQAVDNYLIPDGVNLILSPRLDALQAFIAAGVVGSFTTFRQHVQAFVGLGPLPPPPLGVLSPDERTYIARSRGWRDHVEQHVPGALHRQQIKTDLGIPL